MKRGANRQTDAPVSDRRGDALHPVPRLTVAGATVQALRAKIMAGELPAGVPIRQDDLAAELGVSRIPVREALRQLEAEGLVVLHPHRGAVVSSFSIEEIAELFELRAIIEPDLLRRAIPCLTRNDVERARQVLEAYESALVSGDSRQWGTLNWQFHSILYAPARRPRSMTILQNLNQHCDRYIRMQLALTGLKIGRAHV